MSGKNPGKIFSIALLMIVSLICFSISSTVISAALTRYVAPSPAGTGNPGGSCAAPGYNTISAAITAAGPGDTIHVCAGTYIEQINIDKSLTLSGAGMASTHIESPTPASMTIYDQFGSKSPTARYIGHRATDIPVVRIAASNVIVEGFHVDLKNYVFWDVLGSYLVDTTYSRGVGILVDHVETVLGTPDVFTGIVIRNNKLDGFLLNDNGDAIKVLGSATATVSGNIIYAYGEQGISAQATDYPRCTTYYPTVTVNNNIIYGGSSGRGGGTGTEMFFGIGFWSCAAGSADGNTIYNYPTYLVGGPALNVWGIRPVSFTNNIVDSDGGGVGSWGVQLIESTNATFSNNIIRHQEIAGYVGTGSGVISPTATIIGNTIENCNDGFVIDHQTSGAVNIHKNSFTGIASGHWAVRVGGPLGDPWESTGLEGWHGPSTVTVDAKYNWWGSATGPTHTSNPEGTGYKVSDNVDYDPWLCEPYPTTWHTVNRQCLALSSTKLSILTIKKAALICDSGVSGCIDVYNPDPALSGDITDFRYNQYLFNGEQLAEIVVVRDANGAVFLNSMASLLVNNSSKTLCADVTSAGFQSGNLWFGHDLTSLLFNAMPGGFNPDTDKLYQCLWTVTGGSGLSSVNIRIFDLEGNVAQTTSQYWHLNPTILIDVGFDSGTSIQFPPAMAGQTVYSTNTLMIKNIATGGVDLAVYLAGHDLADTSGIGACKDDNGYLTNVIDINNMGYRCKVGTYMSEQYTPLSHLVQANTCRDLSARKCLVQDGWLLNNDLLPDAASPFTSLLYNGHTAECTFQLNVPFPCLGNYSSASAVDVLVRAI